MTAREQDATFESWMQNHQGILFKVVRSFSTHTAEQDDLAQEIRLAIWKSIPNFDGKSKVSSYIYRVALNRAITWKRGKKSREEKLDQYEESLTLETSNPPKTDDRLSLVYAELQKLDEAERALILLHLEGFSYQEIGDALGITATNVGVRLNRTKQKLIERLNGK